jgi:sugar lactone lactonase YvrE
MSYASTTGSPVGSPVVDVRTQGRVYVSSLRGVLIFDPSGQAVGEFALPGAVNFTFGSAGRDVLFITTDDAVWAAVPHSRGA